MDTRREAVTGIAGCLVAAVGAVAGIAAWTPYGRDGLFGGFESASNWNVVWLGLPVMTLGGTAAALGVFALVRGRWRPALGLMTAVTALAALGYGFDVLAGPEPQLCGDPC
ncbi:MULTISPECIES: hypothetical protein [unclassified Streptomyces]|uniref:hypothetical protein n=1 Tax=unclassified Streptomyces TaxID=2593676 RepID=UPI002DDC2335|nr:hypothetical protein [Streptomyces sp. NBC_01237]WRZ73445.1 hypothetical protein OG251_18400 [Streptomyces sp. NBC_01237]